MSIHAHRESFLYALWMFKRNTYRPMCLRIEWREQKVIFDRVKITKGTFTVVGVDNVAVILVVGRSRFCVRLLKARVDVN